MNTRRIPLLGAALLALVAGLWAGLERMGWGLPGDPARLAAAHGPLMVCGFLGALIGLERASSFDAGWGYAAPALASVGALTCLVGPLIAGGLLILGSSVVLVAMSAVVFQRQRSGSSFTMAAAAVLWLVGNVVWIHHGSASDAVGFWAAFLVLTIVGGRFRECPPRPLPRGSFALAAGALGVGTALGPFAGDVAARVAGAGMIGLSAWLVAFDVPRRRLRQHDLLRYEAACSLLGYFWLAVAGALAVSAGTLAPGPGYDMRLHALLVGFVFSMVFGQGPNVFPGLMHKPFSFGARLYLPLALLELSLVLRIAGDATRGVAARQWGGLIGAVSILLFPIMIFSLVLTTHRDSGPGVA